MLPGTRVSSFVNECNTFYGHGEQLLHISGGAKSLWCFLQDATYHNTLNYIIIEHLLRSFSMGFVVLGSCGCTTSTAPDTVPNAHIWLLH